MILRMFFVSRTIIARNRSITFEEQGVVKIFKHSKARKSSGPDNIEGQLLISCEKAIGIYFLLYLLNVPYSTEGAKIMGILYSHPSS